MSKIIWKPAAILSPVPPALVSCGTLERPNALTVAWTGIVNTRPPMTYISLRPERYSHKIIMDSGEFVINLVTEKLVFAADFCGARSGARVEKFKEMKLTAEAASAVSAPVIGQSPLSLECRVRQVTPLGSHDMFLADIVAVGVREEFIDKNGRLDLGKCGLAAYCHGEYYALGKKLGTFGYSVRKKQKRGR